jgi:A/G-specific adenine glycosylase
MELGAIVCLPRQPRCSICPVFSLCATRGTLDAPRKPARQKRRNIYYALDHRKSSVFLVQRSKNASLMPGMWELPEIPVTSAPGDAALTVRHSITVTDYTVRVMRGPVTVDSGGRWVAKTRVPTLPLTGLTRKILRQAQVI